LRRGGCLCGRAQSGQSRVDNLAMSRGNRDQIRRQSPPPKLGTRTGAQKKTNQSGLINAITVDAVGAYEKLRTAVLCAEPVGCVSGCRNPDKSGGGCRGPEGPRGRRDDWVLGVGRSDERVVGVVWRVMLGCGWSVLLTSFLEQLHAVVISDHFLEVVEELEDGKSLFRGPVRGNGEGDREQQAGRSGRFHDLVFRRLRARCSARSRASLARYELPSMTTISKFWTGRSTKETTQAASGNTSLHSTKGRFVVTTVLFCS